VKTSCERFETVSLDVFRSELREVRKAHPLIDYVTFSGSGEPTLHKGLDRFISVIKEELGSQVKICVITNSSLLTDKVVRAELVDADVIIPSLDAAREDAFLALNRPYSGVDLSAIIEGIAALRKEVRAEIWLEVMLVGGVNDRDEDFWALRDAVLKINPHKVQINQPVRPSLEQVRMPSRDRVEALERLLGEHVAVISDAVSREQQQAQEVADASAAVFAYVARHPATVEEIVRATGLAQESCLDALHRLGVDGKVRVRIQNGKAFYAPF
jgi:wyosine [tRNA(Phe)-imidazoG37] synthetase (radical SAM superfamily)